MSMRGRLGSIINRGAPNDISVGVYSLFNNTWVNKPMIIDPKLTPRWASQNVRGIIPKEQDHLMTLKVGIMGLTNTNAEWNRYFYKEQHAKSYRPMAIASRNSLSSSREMVEGTYFNMSGTVTTALYRWTHRMYKSGKDKTGAGRWSWFAIIGKNNTKMIYITCYRVCLVLQYISWEVLTTNSITSWSNKTKRAYFHLTLIYKPYMISKFSCSSICKMDTRSNLQYLAMNLIYAYFSRRHITVALPPHC
jgi:hypothetical protein